MSSEPATQLSMAAYLARVIDTSAALGGIFVARAELPEPPDSAQEARLFAALEKVSRRDGDMVGRVGEQGLALVSARTPSLERTGSGDPSNFAARVVRQLAIANYLPSPAVGVAMHGLDLPTAAAMLSAAEMARTLADRNRLPYLVWSPDLVG